MREHLLDLENIEEKLIDFRFGSYNWNKITKEQGITNFTVNKTVCLTKIDISDTKNGQNATIEIMNCNNRILKQVEYERIGWGKSAKLKNPILLHPNKAYNLNIKFENYDEQFCCFDQQKVPFCQTKDEVQLNFIELSPLLRALFFKPYF